MLWAVGFRPHKREIAFQDAEILAEFWKFIDVGLRAEMEFRRLAGVWILPEWNAAAIGAPRETDRGQAAEGGSC
jgi:hypothetical protein